MTLPSVLSGYISLNLLVAVGFLSLSLISRSIRFFNRALSSDAELKLHYFSLLAILAMVGLASLAHVKGGFTPFFKIWSANSIHATKISSPLIQSGNILSMPLPHGAVDVSFDYVSVTLLVVTTIIAFLGAIIVGRDFLKLFRIVNGSYLVRKIGRTKIQLSETVSIPFSFRSLRFAHVILPARLVLKSEDFSIAVKHELQHHRQGDTVWVYLIWLMRGVCFANPAAYFWGSWIFQIQEFACDEVLVDQKGIDSRAYARCLVEVAASAVADRSMPVCATGFAMFGGGNLLKQRIEKMLFKPTKKVSRSIVFSVGILSCAALVSTAFASASLVQDRRVTMAQAKAMEVSLEKSARFPVVVNDQVLVQLNRFIGTQEGREFMRASLVRMKAYQTQLDASSKKYNAPSELLAIPIVESGYQNLTETLGSSVRSAGLWQFIRSTARNYGLKVNAQVDERLDIKLNTDAALRYLTANYLRFGDWQLAILAYNMGEMALQKGIDSTGSRDAWELIRKGYEGDKDYLPKIIAAILILKNPSALD